MKGPEQYYLEQDFWELEEDGENFSEFENDFVEKYIGLELQPAKEKEELQAVEEVPISQEYEKNEEAEKSEVLEEIKPDRPRLLDILQKAVRNVEKLDFKKTVSKQSDENVADVDLTINKLEQVEESVIAEIDLSEAEQEDVSGTEQVEEVQAEQLANAESTEIIGAKVLETIEAEAVEIEELPIETEHGTEIVRLLDGESDSVDFSALEEEVVEEAVAEKEEFVATNEILEAESSEIDLAESEVVESGKVEIVENETSEISEVDFSVSETELVEAAAISEAEQEDISGTEQVEEVQAEQLANAESTEIIGAKVLETIEAEAVEIEELPIETEHGTEIVRLLDGESDSADFAVFEEEVVEEAVAEKDEFVATNEILEAESPVVEDSPVTVLIEETQTEQLENVESTEIIGVNAVETAEIEQNEIAEAEAVEIEKTVVSEQDFCFDLVKDEPGAVDTELSPLEIIEAKNIESVMPEMDRQEEKIVKPVVLEEMPIDEEILIGEDVLQVGQDLFSNAEEVEFSGITDVVERLKARKELQFVSFKVCEQEFVLPIDCVQEVVNYVEPARIPSKSEYIVGVTPLRGRITPLIRMDRLIKKKTLDTNFKFIAVCRFDGLQVGLIIHSVTTIYRVNQEQIDWNFTGKDDLVCGVVKLNEKLVGILAIDRVIKHTVD